MTPLFDSEKGSKTLAMKGSAEFLIMINALAKKQGISISNLIRLGVMMASVHLELADFADFADIPEIKNNKVIGEILNND